MSPFTQIQTYVQKHVEAAPLAVFRILFGILMFLSLVRFGLNGWIDKFYIQPDFHFSYLGFEWVKPIGVYTYLIFLVCGISSLMVAMGYKYRFAIITFFLSFTYIELMDKSTYLNHYYFISILSFLMIFLPANVYFSLDAYQNEKLRFHRVPAWTVDAIKLLLSIVYFYAGIAKLNSDWLLHAMPLKIWLTAKYDIPFIGGLLQKEWVHYAFSWAGLAYDLFIPFLLWNKKTRYIAFVFVVLFHVMTAILFPIGMFPFIMIFAATIFLGVDLHRGVLKGLGNFLDIHQNLFMNRKKWGLQNHGFARKSLLILSLFFLIQLLVPLRFLLYPGELFWTEEGFRFSWRVMLMEKAGYANFKVVDGKNGRRFYVDNSRFLTPFQEKQMAAQADFILEYAHFLEEYYENEGVEDAQIYVESFAALNGRGSQVFVDPNRDLTQIKRSLKARDWIVPFDDKIIGF